MIKMANKYLVFSAYYKYGETMVKLYKSEKELRDAMLEELSKAESRFGRPFEENQSTEGLIYDCLELGTYIIDNQYGYGIVHVAKIVGDVTNYGALD